MNLQEQTDALRTVYSDICKRLYEPSLRRKTVAVMSQSNKSTWYEALHEKIEYTTLMVENCLISSEPKRALRYLAVLHIFTKRLEEAVEKEYKSLMKAKGLPFAER